MKTLYWFLILNIPLSKALEFIEDDELVEVTPESIRLRKKGRVRT
jgi:GTP-binding protein